MTTSELEVGSENEGIFKKALDSTSTRSKKYSEVVYILS